MKSLPSYAVPDLTRQSRFWGIPIAEKYATKFNIFSFTFKGKNYILTWSRVQKLFLKVSDNCVELMRLSGLSEIVC